MSLKAAGRATDKRRLKKLLVQQLFQRHSSSDIQLSPNFGPKGGFWDFKWKMTRINKCKHLFLVPCMYVFVLGFLVVTFQSLFISAALWFTQLLFCCHSVSAALLNSISPETDSCCGGKLFIIYLF